MRSSRFTIAMALLIPFAGFACESNPQASQPVAAALTDRQAAVVALGYLRENTLPTTGTFVAEERQPKGWLFYYETPFDASARPPSLSYMIRVRDDGTVDHVH